MAKITDEQSQLIKKKYTEYRALGLRKQQARKMVSDETGFGMTTVWDHTWMIENPEDNGIKPIDLSIFSGDSPKTYIITAWGIRVGIDEKFVACLEQMAKTYDAELLLVPLQKSELKYLPPILKEKFHVVTESIKFNDNLQLKYVEGTELVQDPLAGHQGAYPDATTIIPGLVKSLRTEPTQHLVKQLISTGSVGYLDADASDYSEQMDDKDFIRKWRTVSSRRHGKPTAIAENYVVPSALVVDVLDDTLFLTRFVSSHRSGVVYDLNKKFTPKGYEESQPLGLVTGDFHAYYADETAYRAMKEMISFLKPREVILNDFFDGASVNHHEVGSAVRFSKAPSLPEEAAVTKEYLEEICEMSNKVVYLQSNHDNFLMKYLDASERLWRLNGNYKACVELQLHRTVSDDHPIVKLLDLRDFKNLRFVEEKESYYVGRVLTKHGHEGIGGGRAGFLSLAKIYNYYAQGHEHAPKVFRNAMCVGLIGRLDMEYVVGANGMLHANGLIQPDNSCQLLPVIYGNWIK